MKIELCAMLLGAAVLPATLSGSTTNEGYVAKNIVADLTNTATHVDGRLLNPWGIVVGNTMVWVNDNHSGLTTSYTPLGHPLSPIINITNQTGAMGSPDGLVFNDSTQFVISKHAASAPATLLIASEDGTILAWNKSITGSNSVIVADRSGTPAGAVYKGLAIATGTNGQPQIYAANFHAGVVDVFDGHFNYVMSFTDTNLPPFYAPFNVKRIRGKLFVTFALQALPDAHDDSPGAGHGFIDIFDTDGTLLRQFAAQGALNSPWGLAVAPLNFGKFSRALLVGNFGDGWINAYDLLTGKHLGNLKTSTGQDIAIDGLWGLTFERDEVAGHECEFEAERLYYTAGPLGETDGLVGIIRPVQPAIPPAPGGSGGGGGGMW